ncbi:MAG: ADOP family duplicated permease [Vicinamibacteraceae bacterium]
MTWWARLLRRRELDRRLDAELRDHLERQVADETRAGMSEEEARRRARLAFGGLDQMKEACLDARGTRWLEELVQDLRYGWRVLRQSPAFTLVAVLSLALGIGANTAMFTLVNSLLLRALPVRAPAELALLDGGSWTNPIWEQIRDRQTDLFAGAAAWSDTRFDLASGGQTDLVDGIWASGAFFDVLGVHPILGRTFTAADDQRSGGAAGPVAVISYRFWQQRFHGAADAVGASLTVNGTPFTIVGVTPPEFFGALVGQSFDVAVPIACMRLVAGQEGSLDARSFWWLEVIARLKPGQSARDATLALRGVQPQIREATRPQDWVPASLARYLRDPFTMVPAARGQSWIRGRYQQPLWTLMIVVGLVLLIACANIANLLLARGNVRRHELSMRRALGASRVRLARQLLTESLLLAAVGATVGFAFAHWGSRALLSQLASFGNRIFLDLVVDWRVLGFTAAIAIGTAVLFGLAPALRAGHVEPNEVLKEQNGRLAGDRRATLGSVLIVGQVALSLVLVVGAGLFIRTFSALANLDLGMDRDDVLVVRVDARRSAVAPPQRYALYRRAIEAAAAVPGAARAAASLISPVSGAGWNGHFVVRDGPRLSERERQAYINAMTPGWFRVYGTTLLAGRDFDDADRAGRPRVAIINQAFARRFMPGVSPIGHALQWENSGPGGPRLPLQIVGLVEDAAYFSPREAIPPTVYLPMAQAYEEAPADVHIGVRAAGAPAASLIKSVAAAISDVDRNVSLTFRPLEEQIGASLVQERIMAMLSAFFGALALFLAAIGLFGVTTYSVSRRRAEIGVRMALGADAAGIVRLVLGRAAILVCLGIAAGAGVSLWASRFVATLLYNLEPHDPLTLTSSGLVLAVVAALAAWLPARRAARIDPARVLREG